MKIPTRYFLLFGPVSQDFLFFFSLPFFVFFFYLTSVVIFSEQKLQLSVRQYTLPLLLMLFFVCIHLYRFHFVSIWLSFLRFSLVKNGKCNGNDIIIIIITMLPVGRFHIWFFSSVQGMYHFDIWPKLILCELSELKTARVTYESYICFVRINRK